MPHPAPGTSQGKLSLTAATALVMGSIVGTGIFTLPRGLAAYGPLSLVAMVLVTLGALALAQMFSSLSRRLPAEGGPYAYARAAFGERVGFLSAWSYFGTSWASNAGIAVAWVGYVEVFLNRGHNRLGSALLALVGLWVPLLINAAGLRFMSAVQVITTVLKFIPLLLLSTLGLVHIRSANLALGPTPIAPSGLMGAMSLGLFSYLGVEAASIAAARVRDPRRNVPKATLLGTLLCAAVYLLSLTAVMGIVPRAQLTGSSAPFADALNTMFGGTWTGGLVAAAVVISGFGALNGWTMICAEMPRAAARDGLFPPVFGRLSDRGVPVRGMVISALLASLAVGISYWGSRGAAVFTTLVLLSGITSAIPYALSAAAQIKWRLADPRSRATGRLLRDLALAAVGLVFSLLFIYGSRNEGGSWLVVWSPFLAAGGVLLLGVPVYLLTRERA
jgi:basic amino acid/polyamine antiporter, APA family